MTNITTIKVAVEVVGGLSKPSKMPSVGISLPATACKVGQKLRKVKGSVCSKCYACKGMYVFSNVKAALAKRLEAIRNPEWVDAMVFLLENKKIVKETGVFRWHDSGDIQDAEHLAKIVEVVNRTPNVMHWIPTKEKGLVTRYFRENDMPENLVIRISGAMIDGAAPKGFPFTSTVVSDPAKATCRAFERNGECGDCRMCWDKTVANVSYHTH